MSLSVLGCCGFKSSTCTSGGQSEEAFQVVIGNGGGFTGLYTGYRIDSNGAVRRWSGFSGKVDSLRAIGKLSGKEMARLKASVKAIDFMSIPTGEPGNITSFVEARIDSVSHRAAWAGMYEDAPPALQPLVQDLLNIAKKFEGTEKQ